MKYLFLSLRPRHWVKNFFIFLPLIFGQKLFDIQASLNIIIAFFIFSIISGVVYLVNDVIDLDADRSHPTKHLRPIASGKISVRSACVSALVLGLISVFCAFRLMPDFGWVVLTYLIFNFLYSKILKKVVIIDVFCLGAFFLLRVVAGSVIADVEISHWMLIMTTLLALFLGFNKRRQELSIQGAADSSSRHVLFEYNIYFIDQIISIITSSIVVVYMLYAVDGRTVAEFGSTHLIYSVPFVYYGIFRYLYVVHKLHDGGDPVAIFLEDKMMQLNLFLWILVCILVVYFKA